MWYAPVFVMFSNRILAISRVNWRMYLKKQAFFKYRGTFIAYSNHMLYEINVDLGKRTSKNRLFLM